MAGSVKPSRRTSSRNGFHVFRLYSSWLVVLVDADVSLSLSFVTERRIVVLDSTRDARNEDLGAAVKPVEVTKALQLTIKDANARPRAARFDVQAIFMVDLSTLFGNGVSSCLNCLARTLL